MPMLSDVGGTPDRIIRKLRRGKAARAGRCPSRSGIWRLPRPPGTGGVNQYGRSQVLPSL